MSVLYLTEQGCKLRKSGRRYEVIVESVCRLSIPAVSIERVVVYGNCRITTPALSALLAEGKEVLYLGRNGRFKGFLSPGYPRNVFVRMAQYERSLDPHYCAAFARGIVREKVRRTRAMIRRWRRNGWLVESGWRNDFPEEALLEECVSPSDCRGWEATAARAAFERFASALPPMFEWGGRNRRPPRDPVNALLSLTYMMLLGQVISACYARGLDPFIGFLHELDYGRPSFALDLLEIFRPDAEHFVLRLFQQEYFTAGDFLYGESLGCRLEPNAFQKYCNRFQSFLERAGEGSGRTVVQRIDRSALATACAFKQMRLPDWKEVDAS